MSSQGLKRRVERVLARHAPRGTNRVTVLCYHSIHPTASYASATPRLFAEHLEWLSQNCNVVPLRRLLSKPATAADDRPLVAITFDDGIWDNHTYALPLLLEAGLTATFFITTGLIDADPSVLRTFCRLYGASAADVRGMSWSEVEEMRLAGMEIGAHTHTHPSLTRVSGEDVAAEMRLSKAILEERLQSSVTSFAYPFGKPRIHFSDATKELARQTGFEAAVAIHYRGVRVTDDLFGIPRFAVTGDSIEVLAGKVYGRLDVLGWWQGTAPSRLSRLTAVDPAVSAESHDKA